MSRCKIWAPASSRRRISCSRCAKSAGQERRRDHRGRRPQLSNDLFGRHGIGFLNPQANHELSILPSLAGRVCRGHSETYINRYAASTYSNSLPCSPRYRTGWTLQVLVSLRGRGAAAQGAIKTRLPARCPSMANQLGTRRKGLYGPEFNEGPAASGTRPSRDLGTCRPALRKPCFSAKLEEAARISKASSNPLPTFSSPRSAWGRIGRPLRGLVTEVAACQKVAITGPRSGHSVRYDAERRNEARATGWTKL